MDIRIFLRCTAIVLGFATFSMAVSTCGYHVRSSAVALSHSQQASQPIAAAISELDEMRVPQGVDSALFEKLRAALRSALEERDDAKAASTPPTGAANAVNDLSIVSNRDGTYAVTWSYRNLGNYDQDGTVGISGLTPIAMHYGETYEATDVNCIQAVIDGSGNLIVDVADITPIAMNFGVNCAGYRIQTSDTSTGPFTTQTNLLLETAAGEGRLGFSAQLPLIPNQYARVVSYDSQGAEGEASAAVLVLGDAPIIAAVSPLTGAPGVGAAFTADVSGTQPLTYSWDFGGGAVPDTSADPSPSVTLAGLGVYSCSVTVVNAFGEDTFDFTLTIGEPPTISHVSPTSAGPNIPIEPTAVVAGTLPYTYLWDFGGGASPNTSTESAPTVTLGSSGCYDASLTITSPYGEATYPFSLSVWFIVPVQSDNDDVGLYTSLCVVNGNPAISYYDSTHGDLKYTRGATANGTLWGDPPPVIVDGIGDVGSQTALCLSGGNPSIAYSTISGFSNWEVWYVRAADENGDAWASPIMLDDCELLYQSISMTLVGGYPAATYYTDWLGNDDELRFIRATSADGSTWGLPVVVDDTNIVGSHTSLKEVNGNPAIAYCYNTASPKELRFVRALDANGSLWDSSIIVDSMMEIGHFTSLEIVNGYPAICYEDHADLILKYVRAANADGSSWGSPVDIESGAGFNNISLTVVNGYPAVSYSYVNVPNNAIKYVQALDIDGASWGTPVVIVQLQSDFGYSSLASVNANPAISYYDIALGDLMYAYKPTN